MKVFVATLLLIILYLQFRLWTGVGSAAWISRLDEDINRQQVENARLEARNDLLYHEIDQLKNGLDAVEEHARSQLGMIREGETFYMIIEDDAPPSASDGAPERNAFPDARD